MCVFIFNHTIHLVVMKAISLVLLKTFRAFKITMNTKINPPRKGIWQVYLAEVIRLKYVQGS